ncbi:MAG TPA: glycosyl hydrolase [Solirubrobacterales bacterium]
MALALALFTVAAGAAAAAAVPATFWGVVPQATPSPEELVRLKQGGVDSIRVPFVWSALQPARGGPFEWAGLDALIEGASDAGIEVLPFLTGAPRWAVPADRRYRSPENLPVRTAAQRSAWKTFVREAVLRYGPTGSFWATHPSVARRPIRTWQIWNEPNFMYFVAKPNPAEYGKLVKLSFSTIRGIDPGAKLILAGLFARPAEANLHRKPPLAYFAADFLDKLYRSTPGIKSKFQGYAIHPYTATYKRLEPYIEEVREVLKENHDAGKGLWLTELGWSSQPPSKKNSFAKGPGGQASQLKGAFRVVERDADKWHLKRVYWFSIDDQKGSCNFCDGSGLFAKGFKAKPAWRQYVNFAGGRAG